MGVKGFSNPESTNVTAPEIGTQIRGTGLSRFAPKNRQRNPLETKPTLPTRRNAPVHRSALFVTVLLILMMGATTACTKNLDGSSNCKEFMNASQEEQYNVVSSLAAEYRKPDYATPLGRPNIPYFCAASPRTTLDELFAGLG